MPVADADRGFFQNNQDGSITLVGLNECTSLSSTLFVLMIVRHAIVKNDISVHDNGQLKFLLEGLGHSKVGNVNEQAIENDIKQCQDGSTNENFLDWLDEYDFEVVDSGTWETSGGLESGRSELGVLKDLKDLLKKHPGKAGAAGMVFKLALKYEISTTHECQHIQIKSIRNSGSINQQCYAQSARF